MRDDAEEAKRRGRTSRLGQIHLNLVTSSAVLEVSEPAVALRVRRKNFIVDLRELPGVDGDEDVLFVEACLKEGGQRVRKASR